MSGRRKILLFALAFAAIAILQKRFIPFEGEAVSASVAVSPELMFGQCFYQLSNVTFSCAITNTLLMTWVVMLILIALAFFATRHMHLIPTSLQNVMEFAVESIANLCESVAGSERGKKFFPVVATIFFFVLVANLLGLVPGFGPIGTITLKVGEPAPKSLIVWGETTAFAAQHEEEGAPAILAPFFRSPSTDVNTTLALALVAVFLIEFWGFQALGLAGYGSKFLNLKRVGQFFAGLVGGKKKWGDLVFGLLDVFIGLIELVSEFAKIIAFTFRLFGNIFAGEVVLLIMAFLFLMLPLIFYGFEVFVGFIQAFVFAVLTLAFMTIATTGHGGEEHH